MPYYEFLDDPGHRQELQMSFAEHAKLLNDFKGIYIECNVRFGDKDMPRCPYRAYQVFDKNVGIIIQ